MKKRKHTRNYVIHIWVLYAYNILYTREATKTQYTLHSQNSHFLYFLLWLFFTWFFFLYVCFYEQHAITTFLCIPISYVWFPLSLHFCSDLKSHFADLKVRILFEYHIIFQDYSGNMILLLVLTIVSLSILVCHSVCYTHKSVSYDFLQRLYTPCIVTEVFPFCLVCGRSRRDLFCSRI